ncbi:MULTISPECIES: molybdenum cofactor biosynthesis protein MoaE [Gudongella]|mgnify:CR=1 FL=1|jgi:molybdopterin synthase catalytic subunit|uniref:molybdenum cofactor biosynthesis protein MoaE n=1 Tax=Gudongella oleilytica TaxID=1582259 RepID=UPI002A35E410|nr:molybdenum cofactor biosynthesis protein MoaE [Gudongella oleilytica]MDY0257397.1 molybdenum cofactor biosynthesis protein MoaE [Gudongella oleilytica]
MSKKSPSMDQWIKEAKEHPSAARVGMYLFHNGVVRETPKAKVRMGIDDGTIVEKLDFTFDQAKVDRAIEETLERDGIFYVNTWLNEGTLDVGEDIMYVLIGGDIRPNVVDGLQFLVERIKTQCVVEIESLI